MLQPELTRDGPSCYHIISPLFSTFYTSLTDLLHERARRYAAPAVASRPEGLSGVAGNLLAVPAEAGVAAVEDGGLLRVG